MTKGHVCEHSHSKIKSVELEQPHGTLWHIYRPNEVPTALALHTTARGNQFEMKKPGKPGFFISINR